MRLSRGAPAALVLMLAWVVGAPALPVGAQPSDCQVWRSQAEQIVKSSAAGQPSAVGTAGDLMKRKQEVFAQYLKATSEDEKRRLKAELDRLSGDIDKLGSAPSGASGVQLADVDRMSCAELRSFLEARGVNPAGGGGARRDISAELDLRGGSYFFRIKDVSVEGEKVTVRAEQSDADPETGAKFRPVTRVYDRAEFLATLRGDLKNKYWYDPASDRFLTSYDEGGSAYRLTGEMVREADPELFGEILQSSIRESRLILEQSYGISNGIENGGVSPELARQLEVEMRWTGAAQELVVGAAELALVELAATPKWIKTASNFDPQPYIDTAEAICVVTKSVRDGWVEGAGPRLLETFGGREGVKRWLKEDKQARELLFDYAKWHPTPRREYDESYFDVKNRPVPIMEIYSAEDAARIDQTADDLSHLLVTQIIYWDRANREGRRLDLLEKAEYRLRSRPK